MKENWSSDPGIEHEGTFAEFDLRQIIGILVRWKWLIILITILALLASYIVSYFILPPIYEAQTTLLVVQGEDKTRVQTTNDNLEALIGSISRLPEMTIKTYVEQIKDPVLLGEVVKELDLTAMGYGLNSLQGMVQATAIQDTNLIEVKVQNTDPQLAKDITATLTTLLLDSISRSTQEQMTRSVDFLQQQANTVRTELEKEREKQKELDGQPRSLEYLEQERSRITNDLTKYRSMYLDSQITQQEAEAGLDQLTARLKEIPATLDGSSNPLYISTQTQINEKKLLLAEKNAQLKTITKYIAELETSLNQLQVEITNKKQESQTVSTKVAEKEKTLALLNEKITQTQITKSANLGETSLLVISPAMLNTNPVKPNKQLNMMMAVVLGVLVSSFLAFVLEMLDNKIRSKEDLEKHLGLPILGVVPKFKNYSPDDRPEERI